MKMFGAQQKLILKAMKENPGSTPHELINLTNVPLRRIYECIYRLRKRWNIPIKMIDGKYILDENFKIEGLIKKNPLQKEKRKRDIILEALQNAPHGIDIETLKNCAGVTKGSVTAHISYLRHVGHVIVADNCLYYYNGMKKQDDSEPIRATIPKTDNVFIINNDMIKQVYPLLPDKFKSEFKALVDKVRVFNKLFPALINANEIIEAVQ